MFVGKIYFVHLSFSLLNWIDCKCFLRGFVVFFLKLTCDFELVLSDIRLGILIRTIQVLLTSVYFV